MNKSKERKPNGYWTKEKCHEEALKYNSKIEFVNNSSVYYSSLRKGWLQEITNHMTENIKCDGYWNDKNKCHEEALKYETRKEFHDKSSTVFKYAKKNVWLDEVCSHIKIKGGLYKRLVYIFEFSDESIYIGLTGDFERRCLEHLGSDDDSTVFKYIKKTGLIPTYKALSEYLPIQDAIRLEIDTIENYKSNGYNLINSRKGGGLGYSKIKMKL